MHTATYTVILTNKLVLNIINSYHIDIPLLRGSPAIKMSEHIQHVHSHNETF